MVKQEPRGSSSEDETSTCDDSGIDGTLGGPVAHREKKKPRRVVLGSSKPSDMLLKRMRNVKTGKTLYIHK